MLHLIQVMWSPYKGWSEIVLSLILFLVTAGVFLAGRKMKEPIKLPKMGRGLGVVMVIVLAFCILLFLQINLIFSRYIGSASSLGPIFPVTIASAIATFCYAAYSSRRGGPLSSLGNGILGFIAGPMVFELPFVLIILPLVKAPLIATIIFVTPLFGIVFSTLSLLLLSRRIALTKNSVYLFGAMMLVFALWALDGYAYPTAPLAIALNDISKILSFACVGALFLQKSQTKADVSGSKIEERNVTPTSKSSL